MKKVKRHHLQQYSLLRLYREDIIELVEILQAEYGPIKLTFDNYECTVDELEELSKILPSPSSFATYGMTKNSSTCVSLRFDETSAAVSTTDDSDTSSLGILSKLDGVLKTKHRWTRLLLNAPLFSGLLVDPCTRGTLIYLTERPTTPGFFVRNKDVLLRMVIAATFGAALALGVSYILKPSETKANKTKDNTPTSQPATTQPK